MREDLAADVLAVLEGDVRIGTEIRLTRKFGSFPVGAEGVIDRHRPHAGAFDVHAAMRDGRGLSLNREGFEVIARDD